MFGWRHPLLAVFRRDALDEIGFIRATGFDNVQRLFAIEEAQIGGLLDAAVAGQTVLTQDRSDIAVEFDSRLRRVHSTEKKPHGKKNADQHHGRTVQLCAFKAVDDEPLF